MAIINGVDTSTVDYAALGQLLRAQQAAQQGLITTPSPSEYAQWGNQRRAVNDAYGNSQAQLAFDRSQSQAGQAFETAELGKNWDRTRQALPGQYAHRGLLNSGIYGGALKQYGQDRASASSALALKYQQQFGQQGLAGQRATTAYTSGIAGVDTAEGARRQELASQLAGVV